jgi:thioredoxin 1
MITNVTDADFKDKVLDSSKPVLVDFWAVWCAPCKMLAPVIEQVSKKLEENIEVAKLDVDQNPQTSMTYGITSIPTLILFNQGKPVGKIVGFKPADQIEAAIRGALNL